MSQLDLSISAEVSARHISFLETGRSSPSSEMVIVLAEALDIPMRDTNLLLRASGFDSLYPEPTAGELLAGPVGEAISTMFEHHEPFPMMVVDRLYNVVRSNQAGVKLLAFAGVKSESIEAGEVNVLRLFCEPAVRELIEDWGVTVRTVLRRLQRATECDLRRAAHRELLCVGPPDAYALRTALGVVD